MLSLVAEMEEAGWCHEDDADTGRYPQGQVRIFFKGVDKKKYFFNLII